MILFYQLPKFNYHKPKDLNEALKLLKEIKDAKPIAGGTDLMVDMKIGRVKAGNLIDISNLRELRKIEFHKDNVIIGAAVTLQEIINDERIRREIPILAEAAESMGSWQIRNVATIGGNICNASPAADMAPPLMVLNSKLKLSSINGDRIIPIEKFFKGPRQTELMAEEILTEIIVPRESCNAGMKFMKIGRRRAHTLSIVATAVAVRTTEDKIEYVRIALNSIAPTPIRAYKTEEELIGSRIDEVDVKVKKLTEEIKPISDVRASAEYRREMAVKITMEALKRSIENWRCKER
ncbi:MAG: xanthine dehydrogenase family protein subunit M [archaeon YNP-LCB-003-016]|uniref:FAD binding domain-containing protein n=1 Tax=Candidatus Culexarchaeum yellowstonense TaxID=2928963 RepID=UPI0026EA9440|nr:xanthine dehydrogenase family protein subunit M [Candidatus Culexarchaeum yellowstonense]MCR6691842.1 xanthine dehydrogenase family protein subunit M [Candidatus Culexarchaeum yellowstonense]